MSSDGLQRFRKGKKRKEKTTMKRREFLRTGLALGAATALPAAITAGATGIEDEIEVEKLLRAMREFDTDKISLPPDKSNTLIITCSIRPIPSPSPLQPSGCGAVLSQEELDRLLSMVIEIGEREYDLWKRLSRLERELSSEMRLDISRCGGGGYDLLDTASEVPYEFIIERESVAKGRIFPDHYLAFNRGWAMEKIPGIATIEPVKGTPALWIEESMKDRAKSSGYTVVEANAVIVAHLAETIRKDAKNALERRKARKEEDVELMRGSIGYAELTADMTSKYKYLAPAETMTVFAGCMIGEGVKVL